MTNPTLALIGCGAAAVSYYVPALRKMPEVCKHLCLVDRDLERARGLASELGASRVFADHREILEIANGVIVAVPHLLHYPVAMDCLKQGVHVFCEKPVAVDGVELRGMLGEAERAGVALAVNNTRRLFPNFKHIKNLIQTGALGDLQSITMVQGEKFGWQSLTGFYVDPSVSAKGVLLDLGAHLLDLVCWWLDARPELVAYHDDSFGGPESTCHVTARAGVIEIAVRLNRLTDMPSFYVLRGTKGTVICNPDDWNRLRLMQPDGQGTELVFPSRERTYKEFVGTLLHNFIDVTRGVAVPIIDGRSVLNSIDLIDECYEKRHRLDSPWIDDLRDLMI